MRNEGNRFLKSRTRWLRYKGGGGSAPSSQTVTQTSEPPDYVIGPAQNYLSRATDLSNQPYSTYEGQRIAPLNSVHQYALDQGRQAMGSAVPNAMNTMNTFAQGGYNSPAYIHPFLGPMLPNNTMPGYQGLSPMPGVGGKGGPIGGGQPAPGGVPAPGGGPPAPAPFVPPPQPAPTPTPAAPAPAPAAAPAPAMVPLTAQLSAYNQGLWPGMEVPEWRVQQIRNMNYLQNRWDSHGGSDGGPGDNE